MKRKLKALGLMFAALLALVGLSSSAMATEFHAEASHIGISGSQAKEGGDIFIVNAGTVSCNKATYSGTSNAATTSEITVTPWYDECTAFGFVSTKIDVPGGNVAAGANGGCDYKFTPATAESKLHIICGSGEFITVTAFNCHVKIGSQTASGTEYTNGGAGPGRDVTITTNISGLTYTQEPKMFPKCTAGTFSNGSFQGATTVTAINTVGAAVGLWHE